MFQKLSSLCIVSALIFAHYMARLPNPFDPITWAGTAATIVNICNPHATTEWQWNSGRPIIILHNFVTAKPSGYRGITLGNVVAVARRPSEDWSDHMEYDDIIDHEMAHVKQHNVLGSVYLPVYTASVSWSYITTNTYDEANPLEWGPYQDQPVAWWWEKHYHIKPIVASKE